MPTWCQCEEKMVEPSMCGGCDFKWPVEHGGAYVIIETKTIWFWQRLRYSWRSGWTVREDGWLRLTVERCIG